MRKRLGWKRVVLLVWAVALVFGLSFQAAQVQAAHTDCSNTCDKMCGNDKCGGYFETNCGCAWACTNGSSGHTVCVL